LPIPTPGDDEAEGDFISRCMSNETMKEDFPDNDQRLAVCFSRWEHRDEKTFAEFEAIAEAVQGGFMRRARALALLQRLR
jgi:hypothetical protein